MIWLGCSIPVAAVGSMTAWDVPDGAVSAAVKNCKAGVNETNRLQGELAQQIDAKLDAWDAEHAS